MPRLTRDTRLVVIGMLSGGRSKKSVVRYFGVDHRTVKKLADRHRETGSVYHRPRSGRERVIKQGQDRHIVLQHLRNRFRTAVETTRETPGTNNHRISPSKVRRRRRDANLRAHRQYRGNPRTLERRHRRRKWCCRYRGSEISGLEPSPVHR